MKINVAELLHRSSQLDRNHLSFCENSIHGLQAWADHLIDLALGSAAKALLNALIEISELNCTELQRFDFIQVLQPLSQHIFSLLEKHAIDPSFIHHDRHQHLIELLLLLQGQYSKIYIDIAQRTNQHLQQQTWFSRCLKTQKNLDLARVIASYIALQQLSRLLYQQQILYQSTLKDQWQIAHQLMQQALTQNYHLIDINVLLGTNYALSNIQQAYAQLILFSLFNPHQLHTSDTEKLYLCSLDWAKLIYISNKPTAQTRYLINSKQDYPVVYQANKDQPQQPDLFISTQHLLNYLKLNTDSQRYLLIGNQKIHLGPSLHFHLDHVLHQTTGRRHPRHAQSASLKLYAGLETAYHYLSQTSARRSSPNQAQAAAPHTRPHPLWAKFITEPQPKCHTLTILDMSVRGYRVQCATDTVQLKIGLFILIQENHQSTWHAGIIRWIKHDHQNLQLGLEVLAENIAICHAYCPQQSQVCYRYPAFMLQQQQLDQISTCLIVASNTALKIKQSIKLDLGENQLSIYLVKIVLITQHVIGFHFELCHAQEQSILDHFLYQQFNHIKNYNFWGTSK